MTATVDMTGSFGVTRNYLLVTLVTSIVWGCSFDFFEPFRQILNLKNHKSKKKKDPRALRKMKDGELQSGVKDHGVASLTCPSCRNPYDKGKRRRLLENCGHERCYACMVDSDRCLLCQKIVVNPIDIHNNERLETKATSRPRMKTNGHFTTFMQSRTTPDKQIYPSSILDADESIFDIEPPKRLSTWQRKRQQRPTTVNVDSHSALSELAKLHRWPVNMVRKIKSLWNIQQENPAKAQTNRRTDEPSDNSSLYARLGLLLGDDAGIKGSRGHSTDTAKRSNNSHGSYASISSLASSDANMPASNNTSPVSTLTGSEADPVSGTSSTSSNKGNGFGMTARDPSLDSVTSLMSGITTGGHSLASSSSSGGLIHAPNAFHRQDFARLSDRCPPIGKRTAFVRRSDRTCSTGVPPASANSKGRLYALRAAQIPLKPLFFEVPQTETEPTFVGRQWLFHTVQQSLLSSEPRESNNRGVVISGCPGSGKTATILQLVDYSNFGRKKDDPLYQDMSFNEIFDSLSLSSGASKTNSSSGNSSMSDSIYQSQLSLNRDTARQLAGHVVGYHFCQTDNSPTCLVPDFIHSLASQLCQAPQLVAYRELLLEDGKFRELLSLPSCIADPSGSFVKGILEPLHTLRRQGKIPTTTCLIVVDGLNEAEFHKPDYGDTISSFLYKHILQFPSWLKLILTVRTEFLPITKSFPFQHVSLDQVPTNEHLQRDLNGYILSRLRCSRDIQKNITAPSTKGEGSSYTKFAGHLARLSKGCFLFVKMVLDLIEKGHLVIKSSSYKVVPVSLTEVYLLLFNLKFTTIKSYERVNPILQVVLASLYPLSALEIYHSVNAGAVTQPMTWEEFQRRLAVLIGAQFLVERRDGSLMLAHPSLREFLSRRDEHEKTKFLSDPRVGNALIAFRMSRLQAPLEKEQSLSLGHHMLKAHLFKGSDLPRHCAGRDLQALWLLQSSDDLSTGLACLRNIYSPNIKVSRLLLLAGANPDCYTPVPDSSPLIAVASQCGYAQFVSLLLEFGADPNATNEALVCPLILAAQKGHLEVTQILLVGGAKLEHTDNNGWCALVHAAANGHLPIVSHIVQSDWPAAERDRQKPSVEEHSTTFVRAAQQALVMAALNGHIQVSEYLLDLPEVRVNAPDHISGHTPLSAACFAGHTKTCETLIKRGAAVSIVNCQDEPPLACAVSEGQWEIAELLLSQRASIEQRDSYGRTPLMLAAAEGHLGILELLLSKGAGAKAMDKEGLSAIGWAARKGQLQAVQCLLDHSSDINQADKNGRTPLDLAALHGDPDVVKLLLDRGAVMEHVDHSGMRPLDRAIGCGNGPAVSCFLYKGAKLGPQTWAMAEGKPEMLLLLLTKLLDDGGQLYKKMRLKEAAHRFQYALKKFPNPSSLGDKRQAFEQLKFHLCIGLARSKRKLNELQLAKEAADQAIDIRPTAYEGYYVRSCIKRDSGSEKAALDDINQVLSLIPRHSEFRKVVLNTKNDIEDNLQKAITPIEGKENDLTDIVPNSLRNSYMDKSKFGLSGSTDTLDQVCGISLDSVSLTSQRSLAQSLGETSRGVGERPYLALKRGFETAM